MSGIQLWIGGALALVLNLMIVVTLYAAQTGAM